MNSKVVIASYNALAVLERLIDDFPGLLDGDNEDMEVNGGDLVMELTNAIEDNQDLKAYLKEKTE